MEECFSEHNNKVRALSLESNIKMRYLLYSKNIKDLEERKTTVMTAKLLVLGKQKSLRWEIIILDQLSQELKEISARLEVMYALFNSMSWLVDNFNLWDNMDNTREELEKL